MKGLNYEAVVRQYREALRAGQRGQLRGPSEAKILGILIDIAADLGRDFGLIRAIEWAERIVAREDTRAPDKAIVHYFAANAWSGLRQIYRHGEARLGWEQPESEHELAHLRRAKSVIGAVRDPVRRCQILTNLGSALNARGRLVEAMVEWDAALAIDPLFAMAHGNRGAALWWYAGICYDPGHRVHLIRSAHAALEAAVSVGDRQIHPAAECGFADLKAKIEQAVPAEILRPVANSSSSRPLDAEEVAYRKWCAHERLFLNTLNDLGPLKIAMTDVLTLPGFVTALNEGPTLIGFFNQLKQEYVAARWLMFKGVHPDGIHFADRDVTLINTLDYPTYSIQAEQVKFAFRSAYSLFDKMAFFLNDYLGLDIPEREILFRKLWYDRRVPKRGIRSDLRSLNNVFLQALFWLSKDFFEQSMPTVRDIEPSARRVAIIRNELEHKYLKLHDMMVGLSEGRVPEPAHGRDRLAYSISRREFESETLSMLKRARAALMYLAFAVRLEEQRRAAMRDKSGPIMPIVSDIWNDEWKT